MSNKTEKPIKFKNLKSEYDIQSETVAELRERGILVFSTNNEAGHSRANYFYGLGMYAGISDTVVVWDNHTYFIEFKKPGGKQSPGQLDFQTRIEQLGYANISYHVCFSLFEVLDVLGLDYNF